MDKKIKVIIIVIAVLLVVLIVVGVLSFSKYNGEGGNSTSSDEGDNDSGTVLEGSGELYFSSWEEVLEEIQERYVEYNVTVSFEKEEDDCWYFTDSLQREYLYCMSNPTILQLEKTVEENNE